MSLIDSTATRPPMKGTPVQNKTLITVTAIVALVALGVGVLTLFIL